MARNWRGVDPFLEKLCAAGIIELSDSKYCNPLRIVIKSEGSVRVCLDARYISSIIESDHKCPPLISELIQKFYGIKFMTITDFATGY